jgi:hypothetical protein
MKKVGLCGLIAISSLLANGLSIQAVSAQSAGGGKDLSARVGKCPAGEAFVAPIGLAAAAASSIAGVAVDAAIKYLTQESSAKSVATKSLTSSDEYELFQANSCLYVYAYTDKLVDVLGRTFTVDSISKIGKNNLTPFFAVIRFQENKPAFSPNGNSSAADTSDLLERHFKPVIVSWHYSSFIGTECPLFRDCGRRDVAASLTIANPTASTPSETKNKAVPLSLAFMRARPSQVAASLMNQRNMLWFAYNVTKANVSNLEFTLVETSKPGALANALAQTATDNKKLIQDTVKVVIYNPPAKP